MPRTVTLNQYTAPVCAPPLDSGIPAGTTDRAGALIILSAADGPRCWGAAAPARVRASGSRIEHRAIAPPAAPA